MTLKLPKHTPHLPSKSPKSKMPLVSPALSLPTKVAVAFLLTKVSDWTV
ncbi:hypothetical protein PC119_g5376 [Phytophthora cactorum]|uniref:Uncharacterized protein n=1 Tax=Phytophthora cactorum TaxID=29920 RepID=A0A8T1E4D5_9STRA|nr:hypothetical protein PC115_g5821 [Phytophthora cactorum]KAG2949146.1 hypothetical protein PC117_g5459 [Phytophthora cactorum]KAG3025797.1 hypothetical protein PC120_g6272 [Phytophthora cactorum]KAG3033193.1 hypothetical protein PC119_g5376 [Phytophthora cactorum]KAG3088595.1 hypothetical protein PC122_g8283 [Phytophthora cactorum]